ncbi:MAG: cation-translocating P-type ATPase [Chloroflexi bacterium]|nr:cation-translocating P-type ATPase [Chloroflexota bacterium]
MQERSEQTHISPSPEVPPHSRSADDVLTGLGVEPSAGLSSAEAESRLLRDGLNQLNVETPPGLLTLAIRQFKSAIVLLLVVAAIISLLAGDAKDAVVILAILIINAAIGAVQEARAEQALAALREMTPAQARARRDGHEHDLLARDLVRGDIVLVRSGDVVPADGRLISAVSLTVDESTLTGESLPIEKDPAALAEPGAVPGDRVSMAFQGTAVTGGHGELVVTATGLKTEMGLIAASLASSAPPQTPLERQVDWLTRFLSLLAVGAAVAVFLLGLARGESLENLFLVALSLAVAAVPEGLPAVVTIVLALGVQRMARRQAIVRRLAAVEALGSATVICTDKTGTLTLGEMQVTEILVDGRALAVSGSTVHEGTTQVDPTTAPALPDLLVAAVLCNNAQDGSASAGDPTERALLHLAQRLGIQVALLRDEAPRTHEIPFDSVRKRMATVHCKPDGGTIYVKGAPDVVLALCTRQLTADGEHALTSDALSQVHADLETLARQGLRTLALARRPMQASDEDACADDPARAGDALERELTLLGILGLMDPPRPEARAALAEAHDARIRTIMVTGDHPVTAQAIGLQLGLIHEGESRILTGIELAQLDGPALQRATEDVAICARVAPQQKVEIVRALQASGEVVGMTGDGANDAPALRLADIGVAMGQRGTAVSKEAAAIVLADDNYATIVSAIEEGRTIYANLRKTIIYLVSGNVGEVLTILVAMLAGLPLPFQAIQILWINVVTDSLPAIGLAMEPAEPGVMRHPPRARGEPFLPRWIMPLMLVPSVLLAAISLIALVVTLGRFPDDLATAQTTAFATLIVGHLFIGWAQRSTLGSVLPLPLLSNRTLVLSIVLGVGTLIPLLYTEVGQELFHTAPLDVWSWLLALGLSPVPWIGSEIVKLLERRRRASEVQQS